MDAGASGVRVKDRVAGGFGLCRGHALQVKGVHHVGRDVRFEVVDGNGKVRSAEVYILKDTFA